jgi:hypothetical protein
VYKGGKRLHKLFGSATFSAKKFETKLKELIAEKLDKRREKDKDKDESKDKGKGKEILKIV